MGGGVAITRRGGWTWDAGDMGTGMIATRFRIMGNIGRRTWELDKGRHEVDKAILRTVDYLVVVEVKRRSSTEWYP